MLFFDDSVHLKFLKLLLLPRFSVGTVFFCVEGFSLLSLNKSSNHVPKQFKTSLIKPKERLPKLIATFQMFAGRLQAGFDVSWSPSQTMSLKVFNDEPQRSSVKHQATSSTVIFKDIWGFLLMSFDVFLSKPLEIFHFKPCPGLSLTDFVFLCFAMMQHSETAGNASVASLLQVSISYLLLSSRLIYFCIVISTSEHSLSGVSLNQVLM